MPCSNHASFPLNIIFRILVTLSAPWTLRTCFVGPIDVITNIGSMPCNIDRGPIYSSLKVTWILTAWLLNQLFKDENAAICTEYTIWYRLVCELNNRCVGNRIKIVEPYRLNKTKLAKLGAATVAWDQSNSESCSRYSCSNIFYQHQID